MSWNDPCSKCGQPRRDCECVSEKPTPSVIDYSGRFKVVEYVFFGGSAVIDENLSYDEAKQKAFSYQMDVDAYTHYSVEPQ